MNTRLQTFQLIDDFRERKRFDTSSLNPLKIKHSKGNRFTKKQRGDLVVEGQSYPDRIEELCERAGISNQTFESWTREFLSEQRKTEVPVKSISWTEDDKFRVVIEGKSGTTSIAELCRREQITQDTFLEWTKEFNKARSVLDWEQKSKTLDPGVQNKRNLVRFTRNGDVLDYIENYVNFTEEKLTVLVKAGSPKVQEINGQRSIVCLERINDVRYINKFFEQVNDKLEDNGIFVGCLETFSARKNRKIVNNIPIVRNIYFSMEFLFKRILPKLSWTKKYYFDITKGSDRLLSKAEGLGRLVSCGFSIMDYKSIDGLLYFVVKKTSEPKFDMNPSYGPIYKMPRLGKNGKIIGVYKFRTMHPYSEYLQDYIVRAHGYSNTGKPANDFRIPAWAKVMRKFWMDELPQLINLIKGDLKLVGIRPVSERYFQDIPKEMQKLRLTQKPGCIPPYVALNRDGNVLSVLQAEKQYLEDKIQNPYTTDIKYFFAALFNILFRNKRSA